MTETFLYGKEFVVCMSKRGVEVSSLFADESRVHDLVHQLASLVHEFADFVLARSPVELAHSRVLGSRIQKVCDELSEIMHGARKTVGALMVDQSHVHIGKRRCLLQDVSDDAALVHADCELIGSLGSAFFEADDRKRAFDNIAEAHNRLLFHVSRLVSDENLLKLGGDL